MDNKPIKQLSNERKHEYNVNRIPAIVPLAALQFGVYYLEGHISLKNGPIAPS
jgi:hypothetical protein